MIFFINRCLNIDEKERWTISQLVKHPFLIAANTTKNNIALAAADNSSGHDEADKQLEEENFLRTLNELNIANKTRLMTDFEILDSLGQGGFGSVIKVRLSTLLREGCLLLLIEVKGHRL